MMGAMLITVSQIHVYELIGVNSGASPRHLSGPGWRLVAPELLPYRSYQLLPLLPPIFPAQSVPTL